MNIESNESLKPLLEECKKGERSSQKLLYKYCYAYAMSICLRYAENREEAQEVMNDGFLKIFNNLDKFDYQKPFHYWLRRIMINTAIDYYRRNQHQRQTLDLSEARPIADSGDVLADISEQEILRLVQELSPGYRVVFNLYVIEGYKHEEIAQMLGIQVGTSKSNLAKARVHLQQKIQKLYAIKPNE
ncbi:MAG: RNA polymerase sigma factor [Microscillaceae bacterium]|nr:RNA polymerase sigma factor [Microscillaceae bacterium]